MIWLTRDLEDGDDPEDQVAVWRFEPHLVSKSVWWADCPHGTTPLVDYFESIPRRECKRRFGKVPRSGKKIQV